MQCDREEAKTGYSTRMVAVTVAPSSGLFLCGWVKVEQNLGVVAIDI